MLPRWLFVLACVPLTAAALAEEPRAVLTEDMAARLIRQSPAFTGAHAARKFSRIIALNHLEEPDQEGWAVELEWVEGGKTHVGVAPITRVRPASQRAPWLYQHEGWGITAFVEDKTLAEMQVLLKGARLRANEASVVADLRTLISGELAYASENAGAYDELRCLAEPARCIPGYAGVSFLDVRITQPEKTGYRRRFYPGPKFPQGKDVKSASGITAFAYTAVPITIGETGNRGFCVDDTGRICVTDDGSEPRTSGGQCADPCQVLK
jgi:hypothetical protein